MKTHSAPENHASKYFHNFTAVVCNQKLVLQYWSLVVNLLSRKDQIKEKYIRKSHSEDKITPCAPPRCNLLRT